MVVKIGFVGCGRIAERHVADLLKIEEAKIIAVSDIILSRAKDLAERTNARAYEKPEDMLRKEKLDAVYICTPPDVRGIEEVVAEQGVHLFVEKPVALNLNLAERIERKITKSGVLNCVGYMLRYFDTTTIAKKLLDENGPIGLVVGYEYFPLKVSAEPVYPNVVLPGNWLLDKHQAGEQIVESFTHIFDLTRYLVGEVTRVYAELDNLRLTDIDGLNRADASAVILKFKNGAIGSATCAMAGMLGQNLKIIAKGITEEWDVAHRGILKYWKGTEVAEIKPTVDAYFAEDQTFVESIASGDGSAIRSSYSDAVKTLRITLAAVESSRQNKVMTLQ